MPIYEYHCGKCGEFEVMQKMSDKPLTSCPTCRRKVTKLISSTSFHLKGSGWYITDYARKGGSGGETKSSAGSSKSEDKAAKSEDKKSDAGADSKAKKGSSEKAAAA